MINAAGQKGGTWSGEILDLWTQQGQTCVSMRWVEKNGRNGLPHMHADYGLF